MSALAERRWSKKGFKRFMKRDAASAAFLLTGFFLLSSCAHRGRIEEAPNLQDPSEILAQICSVGAGIEQASGVVQIRAKSPEASGQFPASVLVKSLGRILDLEVTNPLGGTEAKIHVEGTQYKIEAGRGKTTRQEKGMGTWGGIPLHFAVDLFLGRVPCPRQQELKITVEPDHFLVVRVPASLSSGEEIFRYGLESSYRGQPAWAKSLEWKRSGIEQSGVQFLFFAPEESTRSPTRWEALSDRGEVKAKWREREIRKSKGESSL
jgi:hypothetical protein